MLNKEKAYQIIDFILNEAKGYDLRVLIESYEEGLTRFANSEIHQNMFEDKTTVTITLQQGKKISEITTTGYENEDLMLAVKETIQNLQLVPEGELEIPLVDFPKVIEVDTFNEDLSQEYNELQRAQMVKKGIDMLEDGYIAYGALSHKVENIIFGNSRGVKRFARSNTVNFSVLIASEDGGSGYAEFSFSDPKNYDITSGFKIAYDKARMNKHPEELEPGAYTVILEPLAVGEMLTYMSFMGFSAKSVQDRRSFLTGKVGEKVFGDNITIIDDHTDKNTVTLPFDLEGYPRQKVVIVENGIAKGLVYDTASAIKDGVQTTGHSVNNLKMGAIPLHLIMATGDQSLEEMISSTEKGLLITRFHYMNIINPRKAELTALTRDGVYKIEKGKIVGAVKNMRFTDSMLNILNNVEAISKERQRVNNYEISTYVPALKINNFHFTGKTDA